MPRQHNNRSDSSHLLPPSLNASDGSHLSSSVRYRLPPRHSDLPRPRRSLRRAPLLRTDISPCRVCRALPAVPAVYCMIKSYRSTPSGTGYRQTHRQAILRSGFSKRTAERACESGSRQTHRKTRPKHETSSNRHDRLSASLSRFINKHMRCEAPAAVPSIDRGDGHTRTDRSIAEQPHGAGGKSYDRLSVSPADAFAAGQAERRRGEYRQAASAAAQREQEESAGAGKAGKDRRKEDGNQNKHYQDRYHPYEATYQT
jgi:hypothetical protein